MTFNRWRPARVLQQDVTRLVWLVVALAVIRGLDYGVGNDANVPPPPPNAPPSPLVGIEEAFPLPVWSVLILTGCAILIIGMLARWHAWVFVGHIALGALYAGLLGGLLVGYLERPYLDGVRSATGLALPVALHLLFAWRMGPRPVTARSTGEPATA